MGSLDEIAAMMPGLNAGALKGAQVDEKAMGCLLYTAIAEYIEINTTKPAVAG